MGEITVALVAIALVLSAVFLPMAFFGGSTGVIYRQFSLTIVSAMILSVLVALILSPALTATLLKQKEKDENGDPVEDSWAGRHFPKAAHLVARGRDKFNDTFDAGIAKYTAAVKAVIDRRWLFGLIYVAIVAVLAILFLRLPSGFLRPRIRASASSSSSCRPARRRTGRRWSRARSRTTSWIRKARTSQPPSRSAAWGLAGPLAVKA